MGSSDLLKEFVELAPKEQFTVMEDELYSGLESKWCIVAKTGEYDRCYPDPNPYVRSMRLDLDDDRASAEAIVFLWDYLKGDGLEVTLLQSYGDGEWIALCQHPYAATMSHRTAAREEAPTRIEALVRACVAYWKEK